MRESENLQLILLSCTHFWHDLRRDHYLMLWTLTGNEDHFRRTIVQSSAPKPSQIWNQIMQLRALSGGIWNLHRQRWQPPWATYSTALPFSWWKSFSLRCLNPYCSSLFQLCPLSLKNMRVHLSQWKTHGNWGGKSTGAPTLLMIALVGTVLAPKKEDLQGAGLSDTKCPSRTIMLYEWTLVTLPVQSRVSSRKSHKLPKARTHEKTSPSLWRSAVWGLESYWPPHLLAGVCWHPSGSKHRVTGAHHCAHQATAMSLLLTNPVANFTRELWNPRFRDWNGGERVLLQGIPFQTT